MTWDFTGDFVDYSSGKPVIHRSLLAHTNRELNKTRFGDILPACQNPAKPLGRIVLSWTLRGGSCKIA